MAAWYKNSFLTIKDIKPHLTSIARTIKDIDGVNDVFIWGSYLKKKNKPNEIIKDLDIIASTDFFSEDFISIINDKFSPLNMDPEYLEDDGFDPRVVAFTKKILKMSQYHIDPWAISNDEKMMHWGPVINDKKEWNTVKKDAQLYANFEMNINNKMLKMANEDTKNHWAVLYDHFINKYLKGIPSGWYELEECKNICYTRILGDKYNGNS